MSMNFRFRRHNMETLIGGISPLDLTTISMESMDDATDFLLSYGFDWSLESDRKELFSFYQKALIFLQSEICREGEVIPTLLTDINELKDLRKLFIYVNEKTPSVSSELRLWSGALLKVLHVVLLYSHDMYSIFPEEIQKQILGPVEQHLHTDPVIGAPILRKNSTDEAIRLYKFEQKPVKEFRSSILKLLAKRKLFAMNIYDNIGFRFVTNSTFDCFRVLRFLMSHSIVNSFHTITDQSVNTVYPSNLFLEVMDHLRTKGESLDSAEINNVLQKKLLENYDRAEYLMKENNFSGEGYKFIKFVSRKMVRVNVNGYPHRFFYPFEVQVLTKEAYLQSIQGEQAHHEYKKRQRLAARLRLLGES
jgi:uncharacterized protein (TIGR04562 family)